jgi:hypothetical protein
MRFGERSFNRRDAEAQGAAKKELQALGLKIAQPFRAGFGASFEERVPEGRQNREPFFRPWRDWSGV